MIPARCLGERPESDRAQLLTRACAHRSTSHVACKVISRRIQRVRVFVFGRWLRLLVVAARAQ